MIPVEKVVGIGPKTLAYLSERGIDSVALLLEAGREVLLQAPGFHESRVRSVLANAALLEEKQSVKATGARQTPTAGQEKKGKKAKKGKKDKSRKEKKGNKEKGKDKKKGKKKKNKNKKDKNKRNKKKKEKKKKGRS